ncbi:MAG: prephenate dehydratase [Dehalococcoidia bacterium]|nr:prephenate dehydratase [Dehalococcoidia bacterium]|tara:strand:+ start:16409 stop:17251 length:843 start_codon:yes stop_codon:yes gene_type:complete
MNKEESKLSYLGPKGTYSEEAALIYTNYKENILSPKKNIFDVLDSVETSDENKGIVPIENSRVGTILETIDYLINSKNIFINKEILLPIEACLITKEKTTDLSEIREIISKPEAINQCNLWIKKNLTKNIKLTEYPSTAEAVSDLRNLDSSVAAIANSRSAEINNCNILVKGIQDYKNNITRFAIVSNYRNDRSGNDKTSIAFDFKVSDEAGLLFKALECFAKRNINLAKIESRPKGNEIGNYIFIIDFDGHIEDKLIAEALDELSRITSLLKVLGSYPK